MTRPVLRPLVSLLVLTLLGACVRGDPTFDPSPATVTRFAGLAGVDVLVMTDLPDAFAAPRELRSLEVRDRVISRLEQAGVPVRREESLDGGGGSLQVELASFPLSADDHAVWVRVSLAELVAPRRGSNLPLLVSTWTRSGKARVQGSDTAALWREIDRLAAEFARDYRAANPYTEGGQRTRR